MEVAAAQHLCDGLHWRVLSARGEVTLEVELESITSTGTGTEDCGERVYAGRVDNSCALCFKRGDRAVEHSDDFAVGARAFIRLPQDADARAVESARDDELRIVRLAVSAACSRHRIGGILPCDHLEHGDGVGDRPGHRAGDIRAVAQRHNTSAGGEPHRRADTNQRVMRRRPTDRVARVGTEADFAFIRGDSRGGATTRARGNAIKRIRILGVTRENRADGFVRRKCPLRHVAFGEHNGAGGADTGDHGGVLPRNPPLEGE